MVGCDIEQMLRQMGVLIDNQLKFHQHSSTAISKATRRLLGLISKSFINLSPLTFLHLYKVILRPYLEYGNIIWRRNYRVDEDSVENGRGDRLNWFHPSDNDRHLSYDERLQCLGFSTISKFKVLIKTPSW